MIKRLFEQVANAVANKDIDADAHEHSLQVATAVLMVEVARADNDFDETEFQALLDLAARHFDLTPEEANELANTAEETAEDVVSLHTFTQRLHGNLDEAEKAKIVGLLWQVAYADGRLDKYEDSLVLKISDLLYVSRGKVMQLKHDAQQAANGVDTAT